MDLSETTVEKFLSVIKTTEIKENREPKQLREIVPIRDWINSDYYIGPLKDALYPYWRQELIEYFESSCTSWIISGSQGTGKTTSGIVAYIRKIYELSCYDYPQRFFQLADYTPIFFAYFSVSMQQASLIGFNDLKTLIDLIPYFKEQAPRDDSIDSIIQFKNNRIMVVPGSGVLHVISTALYGAFLDEANFYTKSGLSKSGDFNKAAKLFAETTQRRQSRFALKGIDHGISLIVASADTASSFTEAQIRKADSKSTKVTIARLWDTKPKGTYLELLT